MILAHHVPIYAEIFALSDFLTDPLLCFGNHETVLTDEITEKIGSNLGDRKDEIVHREMRNMLKNVTQKKYFEVRIPRQFIEKDLHDILKNYGVKDIKVIDLFDETADIAHDMNLPIPDHLHNGFNTIIDIGSIEHVYDTRQCFENLFNMLRLNGQIMLHAPCNGYFDHGFFTFSPECILESLRLNGFEIKYLSYSLEPEGLKLDQPLVWGDALLWCVAKKVKHIDGFVIPQQKACKAMYS
jgi:hypothetical protein